MLPPPPPPPPVPICNMNNKHVNDRANLLAEIRKGATLKRAPIQKPKEDSLFKMTENVSSVKNIFTKFILLSTLRNLKNKNLFLSFYSNVRVFRISQPLILINKRQRIYYKPNYVQR